MEQAIWVSFGAVAAFVMLGIIANLIFTQTSSMSLDDYEYVLDLMKNQCEFVCDAPIDTQLGQDVDMFAGAVLKAQDHKICLYYEEEVSCRICPCDVSNEAGKSVVLNLTSSLAFDTFRKHTYDCSFRKAQQSLVKISCKG